MKDLGPRYEFHCHTILSDGRLLPLALAGEAQARNTAVIAITDHVDPSNIEFAVKSLVNFAKEIEGKVPIKIIPGAEISYLPPELIGQYAKKARELGAKIIVVHGESPVEPVPKGTNRAALKLRGLVNILAHPGWISEKDVKLAADNEIYLELSNRTGHDKGNRHVAKMAKKFGAKLLVNTDAHHDKDLITQAQAYKIARKAGLNEKEAIITIRDNPRELIKRI
ncbi:histidinol phosphate phosphatase domain-containing protein [Candidatus Margulisiibacteriota bacterium]